MKKCVLENNCYVKLMGKLVLKILGKVKFPKTALKRIFSLIILKDLTKKTRKSFFRTNSFATEVITQKPYEEKSNVFSELFSSIFRYVVA